MCDQTEGLCICVRQDRKLEPFTSDRWKEGLVCDQQERECKFTCKLLCCKSCSFYKRVFTKESCKSQLLLSLSKHKVCERCFSCRSLEFCKSSHKLPICCSRSTCRGQIASVLREMHSPRGQSQGGNSTREGYTLTFRFRPNLIRSPNCHKRLCKSPQKPQLAGGIASAFEQKCGGTSSNSKIPGVFLIPKPNNRWRLILDLRTLNTFLNTETFKMETPETIRTSQQAGEWVTSIDFKDAYFHIPIHSPGSVLPVQNTTLSSVDQHPWSSQWWPKRSN